MATAITMSRVEGDNEARGSDSTVTRITYSSPPPRSSIEALNNDARYRRLLYGRGTTSVLHSTTYPTGARIMTERAANSMKESPVYLEPRFTPPDCADAQDLASGKADILDAQLKLAQQPRRDSGVSAELEVALEPLVTEKKVAGNLKRSRPSESVKAAEAVPAEKRRKKSKGASPTSKPSKAHGAAKPARKTSHKRHANGGATSVPDLGHSVERNLTTPPSSVDKVTANNVSSSPPSSIIAKESAPMSSILPTTESHTHEEASAHPTRVPRKLRNKSGGDDLAINGNFDGMGVETVGRMREFRKGKLWYRLEVESTPEWAEEERPVVEPAPARGARRSTARAMSLKE
ncbi:unnamed protein product [Zymoseptoria tritici ST99CH_3D1]|nr:unnamed protein product [Zymoseptoria tritici ST99CH_3D1]